MTDALPDASEVQALYELVGWNRTRQRTVARTEEALRRSEFVACVRADGRLVGFGRLVADGYGALILDVMTHPEHRRQGIATAVLESIVSRARGRFFGITLVDGSGFPDLYRRLGFFDANPTSDRLMYWTEEQVASDDEQVLRVRV